MKREPKTLMRISMALTLCHDQNWQPANDTFGLLWKFFDARKRLILFRMKHPMFLAQRICTTVRLRLLRMLIRCCSSPPANHYLAKLDRLEGQILFMSFARLECSTWVPSMCFSRKYAATTSPCLRFWVRYVFEFRDISLKFIMNQDRDFWCLRSWDELALVESRQEHRAVWIW